VGGGARAALALVLAAGVTAAGGLLVGTAVWRQVATGAATLAIIVAIGRVDALVWPNYTLVLTAALAAGTALATNSLPAELRPGPQRAALVAAGLTAIAVGYGAVVTAVATVRAAVTPQAWSAQLRGYAQQVQVTSWQVPAAAVLIAVVAAFGTPARWRRDALVLGGVLVILAIPGTGAVAWWAVPLLGVVGAALAGWAALFTDDVRSCLLRTGGAALLAMHAGASGLARPWLTAVTFAGITGIGVGIAVLGTRLRPGDRLADRVVDAAGALATVGFPILVGTLSFLGRVDPTKLVPLTILATSISLVVATLAQVAAPGARTATAAGALAAAAGAVALSLRVPQATTVDQGLSLFLLVSAVVAVAARAFEVSPAGLMTGLEAAPAALGALTDAIEGDQKIDIDELSRQPRGRGRSLDGIVLGAAASTAALIGAATRLAAVTVPGIDLVIAAAMVLLAAVGVRALPQTWRRGPRLGATAVGGGLGVIAAVVAVAEGVAALTASVPWWRADLAGWTAHATRWQTFGWQVPATLLLAAAAAWAMLPQPTGSEAGFLALALAGLATPAAFGLVWWSPVVISGVLAVAAGAGAALAGPSERVARERLATAAALGLYAIAVAMARPAGTAAALAGVVAGGAAVAALGYARSRSTTGVTALVAGIASGAAMLALPGTAATIAVISGASHTAILGVALAATVLEVLALLALRASTVDFLIYPAGAVALATLTIALAAMVDLVWLPVWAGLSTVVGVAAAATLHPNRRTISAVLGLGAAPAGLIAAAASAPSWAAALFGPYRTLRQIWAGYAATPPPPHPAQACAALALLAVACAGAGYALGGPVRASVAPAAALPPLAALALVAPAALGAPAAAMPWVAFAVALVTGLGASLLRPARLLRATAGIVCALAGGAALAGSLAARTNTIAAELITVAAAVLVALVGRDPAIRMVAWIVAAAAALALPLTAYAAAGRPVQGTSFWLLGVCALLVGAAWLLASRTPPPRPEPADEPAGEPAGELEPVLGPGRGLRIGSRPSEAAVVELCALVGACLALLLSLHSTRYAAGVLTAWGALIGVAALRRDRTPSRRVWLVRAACAAELGACWLVLYAEQVALPEAYTLPFAVVALGAGAWELRQRSDLSSWLAYGPALAAGFLPTLALVAIQNGSTPRQAALFVAGVVTVLIGSWRRKRAPVVVGGAVAVIVALHELFLLWVLGIVSWYYLFGAAGIFLVGVGATYERRRRDLRRLRGVLSKMS
jgi:hypothetical protein